MFIGRVPGSVVQAKAFRGAPDDNLLTWHVTILNGSVVESGTDETATGEAGPDGIAELIVSTGPGTHPGRSCFSEYDDRHEQCHALQIIGKGP